jgi:hypothetical protein
MEPCPFCSDPMMWLEDAPCFTHTPASTDAGFCYLRHTNFHAEQITWWNTRAATPLIGMREALGPFALAADGNDHLSDKACVMRMFTVGDFRKARAALTVLDVAG